MAASLFFSPDEAVEHYDLQLNCALDQAQLKITLTLKFITLRRLVLVVSCAPSLQACYIFEMLTQHSLKDWGIFDSEGQEIVRRWYKKSWTDSSDDLVQKIWDKVNETVQQHIDAAAKALRE